MYFVQLRIAHARRGTLAPNLRQAGYATEVEAAVLGVKRARFAQRPHTLRRHHSRLGT
jgi:hypothetical protein